MYGVSALLVINVTQHWDYCMARIDKYLTMIVKGLLIKVNISELGWPCVMSALI